MKYSRIVAEFYSLAWALRIETLQGMRELIRQHAFESVRWSAGEIRERIAAANAANGYTPHDRGEARFVTADSFVEGTSPGSSPEMMRATAMEAANGSRNSAPAGSVAVIPIVGIVAHRMNMMGDISGPGGASIQKLTAQFRQALGDGNCKAIVFDVDSPGGSVEGVMELATEIFNARKQKSIVAVCNSMACSAAYWLASAAGELVCTPSGQCGSIGVYMVHQDESKALENDGIKITIIKAGKFKAEGGPSEPLSEEARAAFQSKVDDYYGMFIKAVAQQRGSSQSAVRDGFGQGRSLLAGEAVKARLADRVATLDDVLAKFGVKGSGSSQHSALSSQPEPKAAAAAAQAKLPTDDPNDPNDDDEDDQARCSCACEACKACDYKSGAKACLCIEGCSVNGQCPQHGDRAERLEKLRARTHAKAAKLPPDDTDDGPNDDNDDKAKCQCQCEACKACDYKADGAKSLSTPALSAAEQQKAESERAGDYLSAIARRRRRLQLQ